MPRDNRCIMAFVSCVVGLECCLFVCKGCDGCCVSVCFVRRGSVGTRVRDVMDVVFSVCFERRGSVGTRVWEV